MKQPYPKFLPLLPHAPLLRPGIDKCGVRDEPRAAKWWAETERMVNQACERFWNTRAQQGVFRPMRRDEG
jgi:hypothetical protein